MHDNSGPLRPPPLLPGARVALIAPAGPLRGEEDVRRAEENARSLGWEATAGAHVLERSGYLAGDDAGRLEDLNGALRDRSVDAIWFLRGGYGAMRLLDSVDYDALRTRPRTLIGYSEITALHHAIANRSALSGLHGPCARTPLSAFARDSLARATRGDDSCGVVPEARVFRGGRTSGLLTGGNLALLAALVGTPYLYVPAGAILVLEDVNEPVYRIDRMFRQLRLAGVLSRCAGLVLGAFTERGGDASENGDSALERVLREAAEAVDGPCLAGAPVGHIDDQWTWPMGALAELDAEEQRVSVIGT